MPEPSVCAIGADVSGDGSNRSVSYLWRQYPGRAEIRCCYDEHDAGMAVAVRRHQRFFYGRFSAQRGLSQRGNVDLIGYDAVGVGYGFGELLCTGRLGLPRERVLPFMAGSKPLGGEPAEDKFDDVAIQFAVGLRERLSLSGMATRPGVAKVRPLYRHYKVVLALPREAISQVTSRRFEINERTNRLRLQPKSQLKESPDHFDALLITYFTLCRALLRSNYEWAREFSVWPRK